MTVTAEKHKRGILITLIGLAVNSALAAGKFAAGLFGHSQALIADAVESMADIFSSIIVWRGLVIASVPADDDHPYGHGKAEPLASAIVAVFLLLAAVGIALKAIQQVFTIHPSPKPFTLVVLLAVILIKEVMFRLVRKEAGSLNSLAMHSDAWHHRSDAITSVAAGVGISVALIGGPDWAAADDVAAVVAAGIIAWNGWQLLRPALDELMDTAPGSIFKLEITTTASKVADVRKVEKCIVRKMGYVYFVDMHIEVDPQMTVEQAHAVAHTVKDQVRQAIPTIRDVLVHIEPERRDKPIAGQR